GGQAKRCPGEFTPPCIDADAARIVDSPDRLCHSAGGSPSLLHKEGKKKLKYPFSSLFFACKREGGQAKRCPGEFTPPCIDADAARTAYSPDLLRHSAE
ncbi:MAG: hypothetical protein ACXVJD_04515, partial [Mucilaginibacter sp.]